MASPCIFTFWYFNLPGHATEQGAETELWSEETYSVNDGYKPSSPIQDSFWPLSCLYIF